MMAGISDESDLSDGEQERYRKIRRHEIPNTAIKRFLDDSDLPIPEDNEDFEREVAKQVSDEYVDELVRQYLYAGQQTLNYWVLTGISDYKLEHTVESIEDAFPEREGVEGIPNEPYLADIDVNGEKVFIVFGFFTGTGGVDPQTGRPRSELTTDRCVAVLHNENDGSGESPDVA